MPMVRARRGKQVIVVSKSSFESNFKSKGFVLEGTYADHNQKQEPIGTDIGQNEELMEGQPDVETIPISDMNKEQLMQFAKEQKIDTREAKSVSDARRIIQAEMRKRKEQ